MRGDIFDFHGHSRSFSGPCCSRRNHQPTKRVMKAVKLTSYREDHPNTDSSLPSQAKPGYRSE